jgi:hypothetical protein
MVRWEAVVCANTRQRQHLDQLRVCAVDDVLHQRPNVVVQRALHGVLDERLGIGWRGGE